VNGSGGSSGAGGTAFPGCGTSPFASPDPLFQYQWYIRNTGQAAFSNFGGNANEDIHLCGPSTPRGTGVTVAVVDTGAESGHEDLGNLDVTGTGTTSHNFANGTANPTNTVTTGDHGTSVSGIIAASEGNSKGINGIAAAATLVVYNLLGPGVAQDTIQEAQSIGADGSFTPALGVDVFNQSWGYSLQDAIPLEQVNSAAESNYQYGVDNLRSPYGAVYVKSSGNGFGLDYSMYGECYTALLSCQNANMDPYNTIPYQVVVGAVNAKGIKSSYSTAGSALWVSAPGGEYGYNYSDGYYAPPPTNPQEAFEPAIVTTDQANCTKGYSRSSYSSHTPNPFEDGDTSNATCSYTSTFNGTSSAAPVTSGVIALMLGVNPTLSWREVKFILAKTAEKIDPTFTPVSIQLGNGSYVAEPGWVTNGAGFHFHDWYGFGRIDAGKALDMANPTNFSSQAGFTQGSWTAFADTGWHVGAVTSGPIPDHSTAGATGNVTLSSVELSTIQFIEALQVQVNITHTYPGDVGIELTSPFGTRSVLLNIRNAFGSSTLNITNWVALSNAFYGEDPNGTWTLKVVDGYPQDSGTLLSWYIRVFGH
jgi:hypothetical protein